MRIEAGKTYEVECPFVRTTYTEWDADGASEVPTWCPGVKWEMCAPDDSEAVADGVGKVLYEVVSVHELPGRYHARVFYVRQWVDPDGKQFGKRNLRIKGIQSFQQMIQLYRFGGYEDGFRLRSTQESPILPFTSPISGPIGENPGSGTPEGEIGAGMAGIEGR